MELTLEEGLSSLEGSNAQNGEEATAYVQPDSLSSDLAELGVEFTVHEVGLLLAFVRPLASRMEMHTPAIHSLYLQNTRGVTSRYRGVVTRVHSMRITETRYMERAIRSNKGQSLATTQVGVQLASLTRH